MADNFNVQRLGRALSGFSAGAQGQLPQFQAGLAQRRKEEEAQRTSQRQQFFNTLGGAVDLIKQGRSDLAIQALSQGDANAQRVAGELSNPQTAQEATTELFDTVIRAQAFGDLPRPGAREGFTLSEGATRFDAQGNVIARGGQKAVKPKDVQPQINALRKDIVAAGKDFAKVEAANNRIKKSGAKATPASDISLIFNFMKMNDPGSTVREGEFATAQNAAGAEQRIRNTYNQILSGTRLSPEQRIDFTTQSESLFNAQRDSFDRQIENVLQQADQDNIPRVRVFGTKRLKAFEKRALDRAPAAAPVTAPAPTAGFEGLSNEQLIEMLQQSQ